jgi:hypothetical protein
MNWRRITAILLKFWVRLVNSMSLFHQQIYAFRSNAQHCNGGERFSSKASQQDNKWGQGEQVFFP